MARKVDDSRDRATPVTCLVERPLIDTNLVDTNLIRLITIWSGKPCFRFPAATARRLLPDRVSGFRLRVSGFRLRVSGLEFWPSGFGCRVSGKRERERSPARVPVLAN